MKAHTAPLHHTTPTLNTARPRPRTRRTVARTFAGILGVALATLAADGRASLITDPNPSSNVWSNGNSSNNFDLFSYNSTAGLYSPMTFEVEFFLDDNLGDFNTPYGLIGFPNGTNIMANNGFTRAGTTFDGSAASFYANGPDDTFINTGAFTGGAQAGTNNYVGIEVADTGGREHYGWLQFTLSPASNGTPAVVFTRGYLNDTAGVGVVTGMVPEPSTVTAAVVGLCALVGGCWLSRRRAAAAKA